MELEVVAWQGIRGGARVSNGHKTPYKNRRDLNRRLQFLRRGEKAKNFSSNGRIFFGGGG